MVNNSLSYGQQLPIATSYIIVCKHCVITKKYPWQSKSQVRVDAIVKEEVKTGLLFLRRGHIVEGLPKANCNQQDEGFSSR